MRNVSEATLGLAGTDSEHAFSPNQAHLTKHSCSLNDLRQEQQKNLVFFSEFSFFFICARTRSLNCLDRENVDVLHQPWSCPTVGNESKSCKSRRQTVAALDTGRLGLYCSRSSVLADDGGEHAWLGYVEWMRLGSLWHDRQTFSSACT